MENNATINNPENNNDKSFIQTITESIISIIGFVLGFVGSAIYLALAWGFVLFKFWEWFVITSFENVQPLSYKHAFGLVMIITLFKTFELNLTKTEITANDETKPIIVHKNVDDPITTFIIPWVTFITGYLVLLGQTLL